MQVAFLTCSLAKTLFNCANLKNKQLINNNKRPLCGFCNPETGRMTDHSGHERCKPKQLATLLRAFAYRIQKLISRRRYISRTLQTVYNSYYVLRKMFELKKVQTAIVNNCSGVRNRWDAATGQICSFLIRSSLNSRFDPVSHILQR